MILLLTFKYRLIFLTIKSFRVSSKWFGKWLIILRKYIKNIDINDGKANGTMQINLTAYH